jgi:phosphatidate cytidylyltransferase
MSANDQSSTLVRGLVRFANAFGGPWKLLIGIALVGLLVPGIVLIGMPLVIGLTILTAYVGGWELSRAIAKKWWAATHFLLALTTIGIMWGILESTTPHLGIAVSGGLTLLGLIRWRSDNKTPCPMDYMFGVFWIGGGAAATILIAKCRDPTEILILAALVFTGDIGGQVFGKAFKKYWPAKMAPVLSPNKTWIGLIGSYTFVLGSALIMHAFGVYGETWWDLIGIPAAVNTAGVLGDLYGSSVKRIYDMKDFSRLLGAHGGFLDRVDSWLLASIMYYLLM